MFLLEYSPNLKVSHVSGRVSCAHHEVVWEDQLHVSAAFLPHKHPPVCLGTRSRVGTREGLDALQKTKTLFSPWGCNYD
jgi:hypothetical protein